MAQLTNEWNGAVLAHGRYRVTAKLGEGGMGAVYRAWDSNLQSDVVVKVPRRAMLENREAVERFALEIRSLVKLAHPHIVRIIDVGEQNGLPFAIMQYLSGGSVEDRRPRTAAGAPLPIEPKVIASWLGPVAQALDFIHQQGYVHRDVKPGNILFDQHQNVFLSDFGVAKALWSGIDDNHISNLTGTGLVLGTPDYMAPELVMGEVVDGRVDQYALAVMLYELLAGRPPFAAPTPAAILVKHTIEQPLDVRNFSLDTPEALALAISRGLAKRSADRFNTCSEFAAAAVEAIQGTQNSLASTNATTARLLGGLPAAPTSSVQAGVETMPILVDETPPGSATAYGPKRRNSRWVWLGIGGGAAVVCVLLGVVISILPPGREQTPATPPRSAMADPLVTVLGEDLIASSIQEWKIAEATFPKPPAAVPIDGSFGSADELERHFALQVQQYQELRARPAADRLRASLSEIEDKLSNRQRRVSEMRKLNNLDPPTLAKLLDEEERLRGYSSQLSDMRSKLTRREYEIRFVVSGGVSVQSQAETIRELESCVGSWQKQSLTASTRAAALEFVKGTNKRLRVLGLIALAASGDDKVETEAILATSDAQLSQGDRANICRALLASEEENVEDAVVLCLTAEPQLAAHLEAVSLIERIESRPERWQAALPALTGVFQQAEHARRLFLVQCQSKDANALPVVRKACLTGSLKDSAGEVIHGIVSEEWNAAYPLISELLALPENADLRIPSIDASSLTSLQERSPSSALALAAHWIRTGVTSQFDWVIGVFTSREPFPTQLLQNCLGTERLSINGQLRLLNALLAKDEPAELSVAATILASPEITGSEIELTNIGPNALMQPMLKTALEERLWDGGRAARGWVLRIELGDDFATAATEVEKQVTSLCADWRMVYAALAETTVDSQRGPIFVIQGSVIKQCRAITEESSRERTSKLLAACQVASDALNAAETNAFFKDKLNDLDTLNTFYKQAQQLDESFKPLCGIWRSSFMKELVKTDLSTIRDTESYPLDTTELGITNSKKFIREGSSCYSLLVRDLAKIPHMAK